MREVLTSRNSPCNLLRIKENSVTQRLHPGRLGGHVDRRMGHTMSGVGPSDIQEMEQASVVSS